MTARDGLARLRLWLLCVWYGHEEEILVEPGHLVLRCIRCGHRSPGWAVTTDTKADDENPR